LKIKPLQQAFVAFPEMAPYIENFHSDNLFHFDALKKPYPEIVDPELQFIDQLLDDQIINSLIAPEGYYTVYRDIQTLSAISDGAVKNNQIP
jgi:hypothetical protein